MFSFSQELFLGPSLGLGFGTHDPTTPLLSVFKLVIEVGLKRKQDTQLISSIKSVLNTIKLR